MSVKAIPIVIDPQRIGKGARRDSNRREKRDHPNYSTVEIGQNTEKSSWDLRRLAVAQTPVKDTQFRLVWKTGKKL